MQSNSHVKITLLHLALLRRTHFTFNFYPQYEFVRQRTLTRLESPIFQ